MACSQNSSGTLGGDSFNALKVSSGIKDRGSTGATGRHGASNIWQKWPKVGSKAGITARAPYNIGNPKTPVTLAGSTLHAVGLDLGPHGHGIGVVPAAIGGAHNKRTMLASVSLTRGRSGGFELQAQGGFCFRCFATWAAVGVAVVLLLIFTGR